MDVEEALRALPIVPPETIDKYTQAGSENIGIEHQPMPLAKAAEEIRGNASADVSLGEDHVTSKWSDGAGNKSGVIAVRCGEDAFVLDLWVSMA